MGCSDYVCVRAATYRRTCGGWAVRPGNPRRGPALLLWLARTGPVYRKAGEPSLIRYALSGHGGMLTRWGREGRGRRRGAGEAGSQEHEFNHRGGRERGREGRQDHGAFPRHTSSPVSAVARGPSRRGPVHFGWVGWTLTHWHARMHVHMHRSSSTPWTTSSP